MHSIPSLRRIPSAPPSIKRPRLLRLAALLHLLTRLMLVVAVISAPFFFTVDGLSPALWLVLPGIGVVLGILWAVSASGVRCSVCTMKLLVHQPCVKHSKAARWPGFGYHGTLAVQAFYARRIRCPYCGTPNRVRPGKPAAPDDHGR